MHIREVNPRAVRHKNCELFSDDLVRSKTRIYDLVLRSVSVSGE
jgi:hypothetical protein